MTNADAPKYETPSVTDHGDLLGLTAATTVGTVADQPIPQNGSVLSSLKPAASGPVGNL